MLEKQSNQTLMHLKLPYWTHLANSWESVNKTLKSHNLSFSPWLLLFQHGATLTFKINAVRSMIAGAFMLPRGWGTFWCLSRGHCFERNNIQERDLEKHITQTQKSNAIGTNKASWMLIFQRGSDGTILLCREEAFILRVQWFIQHFSGIRTREDGERMN